MIQQPEDLQLYLQYVFVYEQYYIIIILLLPSPRII